MNTANSIDKTHSTKFCKNCGHRTIFSSRICSNCRNLVNIKTSDNKLNLWVRDSKTGKFVRNNK